MEGHSPIQIEEIKKIQSNNSVLKQGMIEVVCGSVAGAVGKVIEFPFDTIKVRLQSQNEIKYSGPLDCFKKSIKSEGIIGLYRGLMSPVIGAAAENASLFLTYTAAKRMVNNDSLPASLFCGMISGAATSFVLTPIELVKCKMQVLDPNSQQIGLWKMIRQIWSKHGFKGFWQGQSSTFLRECGGSAAWFGANEYVGSLLAPSRQKTVAESAIAGAAAGVAYNVSLFPVDTIKSKIQTQAMNDDGFVKVAKDIFKNGGVAAFYRGCGITMARSAPSSALIFVIYDRLQTLF